MIWLPKGANLALEWTDGFDHVSCVLDERGALADQPIAAMCTWIERRAGHGHHIVPHLGGEA
jgi:hypothetical protein